MFMKLKGKRCLVIGAGKVGEPKIGGLIDTSASIQVVATAASDQVREWADAGKIELALRKFAVSDLEGRFLAVVATASNRLNKLVYREAQRRGVLCNVVDVPEYCDFFYPAVVQRGALQIAISTAGNSPSLAQMLRQQLEQQFGEGYTAWVDRLGATRQLILASDLNQERKSELLHSLASRQAFEAELAKLRGMPGKNEPRVKDAREKDERPALNAKAETA
jgi:precorrin-2 dehydrogenase/sirohydrochlorin ferrochelatase